MAVTYTENGTNTPNGSHLEFTYTFPTIKTDGTDVNVSLDGQTQATSKYTVDDTSSPTKITFNNTSINSTLQESTGAPKTGVIVRVYRNTLLEDADGVTYVAGSSIRAQDLNANYDQLRYAVQEEKNTLLQEENVTDLAITRAKIANDAIDGTKLADDSINSEHYVDGSIDTAHIADSQVTTAKIAGDAITGAKIADDAIDSEHLAADSIDAEHYAAGSVDTTALGADAVTGAKIADDAIDSEHYTDGSIDTAHIGNDQVTADKLANTAVTAGSYTATDLTVDAQGRITAASSGTIARSEIAADAVDGSLIADDAVDSEHLVDGSIDTAHIGAAQVTTAKIADDAISIGKIGCEQTTISDSDSHVPTSGAVVDYVAAQIAPIGGLEVIATDAAFPNTQPASGVVVSIADAGGLVVNGSGVSTTGRTVGSSTVTINGINSSFHSTTIDAGIGMLVTSTGSGQIYDYHKTVIKEADVAQISDDINDFNSRYRIASSAPGSSNDEGDLYFDTTANKMYVYDGSAWGQVTSTGEFKILGVKDNGQAHNGSGPTFNGSNDQYDLFESTSDASITQASQLLVVLNGVLQKPNDSYDAAGEGFALDGADGIRFCDPPPTGSTLFVTKLGSATDIGVPADNSVSAGKTDISLVQGDVIYANGTDSWTRLAKGTAGQFLKMNSGATAPEWGSDNDTNTNVLAGGTITGDVVFDNATNAGNDLTWDMSDNALEFDDNVKATFGDGGDIQIYHDATNSFIKNATGHLKICGDSISFRNAADGEDIAHFVADGACKLLYDNETKIETKANGAIVQDLSASGAYLDIKGSDGVNGKVYGVSGTTIGLLDDQNHYLIKGVKDGAVTLYYDNTAELETKSGGVKLNGHSESVITALTSASSVTIDFSLSNHFSCTMGHNITFANPTTESVGQSGTIVLTQDGTGSRTASWGSQFLWAGGTAPTLSTAANAVDRIDYFVAAADKIHCVASLAMA